MIRGCKSGSPYKLLNNKFSATESTPVGPWRQHVEKDSPKMNLRERPSHCSYTQQVSMPQPTRYEERCRSRKTDRPATHVPMNNAKRSLYEAHRNRVPAHLCSALGLNSNTPLMSGRVVINLSLWKAAHPTCTAADRQDDSRHCGQKCMRSSFGLLKSKRRLHGASCPALRDRVCCQFE